MSRVNEQIQLAYPQAFSILQASLQDWALAEDCLQDAVTRALECWPTELPDNPTAWLITVSRHKAIDVLRRSNKHDSLNEDTTLLDEPFLEADELAGSMNDDVLRLIFSCCHPELEVETQLALTLKHVMSFSTREIATALLVSEKTMEQRLTRAKKKIAQLHLPFEMPESKELDSRLNVVLQVIYLIYNEGYSATSGAQAQRVDLCQEAVRLSRWLHTLVRNQVSIHYAELLGLLALMLSQLARHPTRTDSNGQIILLKQQDRSQWHRQRIVESQVLVEKALAMKQVGPYQIQAAISALHNQAKTYAETDWAQIRLLYQALLRQQDTPVIRLNYGVALSKEFDAAHALPFVESLREQLHQYVPFYAAIGALNKELGHNSAAKEAFESAIEFSDNATSKAFFERQLASL